MFPDAHRASTAGGFVMSGNPAPDEMGDA